VSPDGWGFRPAQYHKRNSMIAATLVGAGPASMLLTVEYGRLAPAASEWDGVCSAAGAFLHNANEGWVRADPSLAAPVSSRCPLVPRALIRSARVRTPEEVTPCCRSTPRDAGPASCTSPPEPSTCPAHSDEGRQLCSLAALCLAGVDIPDRLPCARPPGSICRLCPTDVRRVSGCRGTQVATEADQAPVLISNLLHEPREPIR
jgi:hypothetical protein